MSRQKGVVHSNAFIVPTQSLKEKIQDCEILNLSRTRSKAYLSME